jgi:hypothetical protein
LKSCDEALYENLCQIVQNSARNLSQIEKQRILPPETLFYREAIPFPQKPCSSVLARTHQLSSREGWFKEGFQALQTANLVFLDPDNGVASKKIQKHSHRSVKYAFLDEITPWLQRDQSVVLYQHQRRQPLERQISEQLRELAGAEGAGWALSFHRQSVRIYYVLPGKKHRRQLEERSEAFLRSRWGKDEHFRLHSLDRALR